MKKKILHFAMFVILVFAFGLQAQSNGGYAGAFVRMGLGARHLSMGGSGIAAPTDAYSFYYNPALSAFQKKRVFTLSHRFLSLDRKFDFIGYSMHVPPGAGLSLGWIHSGVGNIDGYNMVGEKTGGIDHSLNALYFSVSRLFANKFAIGLTIKHVREYLGLGGGDSYNASGWGWDFGLAYVLNENLTLAASLRDVSSKFTANTEKLFEFGGTTVDYFPQIFSAGISYQTPLEWLRLNYAYQRTDYVNAHRFGAEATYRNILALRLGLNDGQFTFGAGMGFKLWKFFSTLDYAFVSSVVDEGSSHIFSWQFYLN